MALSSDERIGTELLGYRIEALVGRGGMGVVYRAHDPRLKRNVALKLLAPQLAQDARFRERFLNESELAASLDHPNVIPIYEAGEADGVLYVAMRLVDGKDLKTLLAEERTLTPARALAIAGQIAEALDAAHERGLVHRDVKPSNVLLDKREHAYLADFGLTRRLSGQTPGFESRLSLGTPAYVAPEQIEGKEVDGRADEYSLCCLLYECLTGEPPFPRASEAAVLFAHLEEEPPAPERLAEVMARGLAKDPAGRYPTCTALVEAAREALGIAEPHRARWPFVVAGLGAAVLGAALLAFILGRGASVRVPSIEGNAVAVIDPGSNRVVQQVPVGALPGAIAYGAGSLWVANLDDRTVQRIDPTSGRVVRTLALGDMPESVAASSQAVWVVGSSPNRFSVTVTRIDPRFDAVAKQTRIPIVVSGGGGSVATQKNVVWVAPSSGLLSRLDPRTSRIVQRIDPNAGPGSVAVATDAVWVTDPDANTVTRIDRLGHLTPIAVGRGPSGIAVGAGGVWVADSLDDAVIRIDPRTRRLTTIPVGRAPGGLAVGAGSVWVANRQDGTVMRIDPATRTVETTISVGGSAHGIVVAGGRVWVTVQPEIVGAPEAGVSGGTARVVQKDDWGPLDPALWPDVGNTQVLYATCAKLLNYPDKPAPVGSRLVPEVAESMPALSSGGKTYTFTIRKGFRFSPPLNEPVTAGTFKYALERALSPKMQSYARTFFGDVIGAKAYMAGKAPHITGLVARGNRLVIRLIAPAPDFLARLAMPWSCAVPLDTPLDPAGVRLVPFAGPYFVASYRPAQGPVLERNPNYTGTRPHRLERIELTLGVSGQRAVAEVESGAADYALGGGTVPPDDAARLAARYGPRSLAAKRGEQRYFLHPARPGDGWLHFFLLNTHRPLFQDTRMRRAVNYAIDRRALARIGSRWTSYAPTPVTDQYLPPGLPGFRDVRIYPSTPDLAAARRLAGGKHRTAVLYTCNDSWCERLARIVKMNLNAIRLEVEVKAFPLGVLFQKYASKGAAYDLAWANWVLDYPDPANALLPLEIFPTFDDPVYQRKLAAAAKLSGPRRYLAYEKLDAELARDAAPWLAYANELSADFFSARMGCQIYNPVYGIDLAALCIKKS